MEMGETLSVRALLLDERLETRGLERDDTLATNPFTLRVGRHGRRSGGRHWRPAMFLISGSASNAQGFLPRGLGGVSHLDRTEPPVRVPNVKLTMRRFRLGPPHPRQINVDQRSQHLKVKTLASGIRRDDQPNRMLPNGTFDVIARAAHEPALAKNTRPARPGVDGYRFVRKLGSKRGRHPEYRVEELAKDDGAQPEPIAFEKVVPKHTPFGIGRGTISRPPHDVLQNGDRLAQASGRMHLFGWDRPPSLRS